MAESHWCYKVGFRLSIVVVTGPKSPIFWRSPSSWWYCTLCQNLKYIIQPREIFRIYINSFVFYFIISKMNLEWSLTAGYPFFYFSLSSLTKYLNTFWRTELCRQLQVLYVTFFIFTIIIFFQVDDFFWKKSSHNTWKIKQVHTIKILKFAAKNWLKNGVLFAVTLNSVLKL